ncbi:DoxX family protein [Rubritalea tangerina]|uniref:DoxX family protein n=1 Tax=Rubritalea tangerina TaxID=430798 RepID=A0ABW4Z9R0_9BACT
MMDILLFSLHLIVAFGLLNVWLIRAKKSTPYRGGTAHSMREEFAVYGLPPIFMYLIGTLKVLIAISLLLGLWFPSFTMPAALTLIFLMLGAFSMHLKVKDPFVKALPSLLMLAMAIGIVALTHFTQ